MGNSSKILSLIKYGFSNSKKKFGINYWRFFFNAIEKNSGAQQMFYLEFEMLNPWLSADKAILGYKPRVSISAEDLQYALAGTENAKNIQTETILQPSYCAVRIGKFGKNGKQLCSYYPLNEVSFDAKPFEIVAGQNVFNENKLQGSIHITKEDLNDFPELMCDYGNASWNLSYLMNVLCANGYNANGNRWFPAGLNVSYSGSITFDETEYIIDPSRSYGFMERLWGKSLMEPWFHISSANLISNITGKPLEAASFSVQGVFDQHVSFAGNIEKSQILFSLDGSNKYSDVWQCTQMPSVEEIDQNNLHWSVSIHNKQWIIDVDAFCQINELTNRSIELPEGQRKVLNVLQGGSGSGEIKIYRKSGKNLEQIEFAKFTNCVCEFGHIEEAEL